MAIAMVVFDLAGTTIDDGDAVNVCLRGALNASGISASRESVNEVMGLPKPEAIRLLLERAGEATNRVAAIHADFVERMTRYYRDSPEVAEFEGTSRTFAALRAAGIKVALDTGFSRDIAEAIFDRVGWLRAGLVDASVTSDEVPRGRPHPDMIHSLMKTLGIADAEQVAKVGDTPSDLHEGTAAGCSRVIGVLCGTHTREQLAEHPHTDLIASVAELPSLLGLHTRDD